MAQPAPTTREYPGDLYSPDGNTVRSFTVAAVDDSENDDGEKIEIEFYDLPAGFPAGARSSITVKLKGQRRRQQPAPI